MRKLTFLFLLFVVTVATAQTEQPSPRDTIRRPVDSILINDLKESMLDNLPVISIDESDLGNAGGQNISSVLTAGRDPFFSAAAFNFSPARFRVRGYDNDLNSTFMNGVPMDNLDNGFTPFGLWGGLNDVMRNRDVAIGLRYNTFAFGDLATTTSIDARASRQRKQTQVGYAISNRNYNHRISLYHGTGISKQGWAFTFAGSFRGANEGYVPGTHFNGYSYFAGVDKRIGQNHLLSLVVFGAPTENGRQGASVDEMRELSNNKYYNPSWGYQNGKKRSANVAKTHQPVGILTHEYRINNNTNLVSAVGFSFGDRAITALDWYNVPDPRPDYYRYLPSYQIDSTARVLLQDAMSRDENLRQLNWNRFYEVNRNSTSRFAEGRRSRYILEDRVVNTNRLNFNTVINSRPSDHVDITGGVTWQRQRNNYFKRINDLLGGDYYLDLNQFAERDFPDNQIVNQNDVNRPNRVLRVGDRFGYDYEMTINRGSIWGQSVFKFSKVDFFVAAELSHTYFYREGNVRSGLYPNNSFDRSKIYNFTNYSLKGGTTYKINGRNYIYANAAYMTRAPFFENAFIAPRTRDFVQENMTNETIKTVEAAYVLNAPKLKFRIGGYYTHFDNQLNVLTFYHDEYRNFVNYALSNIDKVHQGIEMGFESRVIRNITITGAAAIGRYYYDSRQDAIVTLDNRREELSRTTIYSKNFRVGGTPQEAYSLGAQYRSPKYWFVGVTGNYFDQMWLEINPLRRTYEALENVDFKSDKWEEILAQRRLPGQTTLDVFAGYSWKLPKSMGFKRNTFLVFNVGVNNILDNQNLITGGFEQLRFDYEGKNVDKFPARLFYGFGVNYFASATFRF